MTSLPQEKAQPETVSALLLPASHVSQDRVSVEMFLALDVSNCAIPITDRAVLNRKRIESRNLKLIFKVKKE